MQRFQPAFGSSLFAVLGMALACATPAAAQGVFKCTQDGKTVYQSTPCASQGRAVSIQSGPSQQQVQEAQKRADAEKARAGSVQQAQPQQPAGASGFVKGGAVDCDKLNRDRELIYGRRNATTRTSRQDNVDNSAQVERYQREIQQIENQMARAGCKPT